MTRAGSSGTARGGTVGRDVSTCPCQTSVSREAAMVTIDPMPMPGVHKGVWCDPCIAPLVKALNDGGLPTVASCCGHGKRSGSIVLADGCELTIGTFDPTNLDAWWSDTYGPHRHRWLHEPAENFVPTALRAVIPKHAKCRPLRFADA